MKPSAHIAWIRDDKFKPGNPLASDLQESIKHLSEGLYSKDIHFILELIQNAEDNRYPAGVAPDLTLRLLGEDPTHTPGAARALLLVNNEVGFSRENVEALCAVGKTTKSKRRGYIGEKGIGFKSVFTVSSRPHLFSNGYQFRFQEEPDPEVRLGFIVPKWVETVPRAIEPYLPGNTCILLPLKAEKVEVVRRELEQIWPETILFLSKLRGITIERPGQGRTKIQRRLITQRHVSVTVGQATSEYWVLQAEVTVPPDLSEPKRQDVSTRIVSVALPLVNRPDVAPPSVLAFLPTEMDSGLPFIVNADFILNAARESIQFDRPWNKWLRDCIGQVWVSAFEAALASLAHRARAYSFIPIRKAKYHAFFEPVAHQILEIMGERALVWTFDDRFDFPSRTRLADDQFRDLAVCESYPAQLKKTPLVHPDIEQYEDQLRAIGVKSLTAEEQKTCLKDSDWLRSRDAQWFSRLYRYLKGKKWATAEGLRDTNLLLLENGDVVTGEEVQVYFPSADAARFAHDRPRWTRWAKVEFLNSELYEQIGDDETITNWVTESLGAYPFSYSNFCIDLIDASCLHHQELTVEDLIEITTFVRDHSSDDQIDDIKARLPLVVADDTVILPREWNDAEPLVMPEALDLAGGWPVVFDEVDRDHLTVLSDWYVVDASDEEQQKWRQFFALLGATDKPKPMLQRWEWAPPNRPHDLTAAAEYFLSNNSVQAGASRYYVEEPAPFHWLEDNQTRSDEERTMRCEALLGWLKHWVSDSNASDSPNDFRGRFSYSWAFRGSFQSPPKLFESELRLQLLITPWLATTHGFEKPSKVFLRKPEITEFFGEGVAYPIHPIDDDLAKWLGIRVSATTADVLALLKSLAHEPAGQANLGLLVRLYKFLGDRWNTDLAAGFSAHALIWVNAPVPRWVTVEDAVWPDLSAVFHTTYAYLEPIEEFGELAEFFVDKLGVKAELNPELYANAWLALQRQDVGPANTQKALARIYPEVLKASEEFPAPEWWHGFSQRAHLWAEDQRFGPPDQVFISDDGNLKEIFSHSQVPFAWIPRGASLADYTDLFERLGAPWLSQEQITSPELPPGEPQDEPAPLLTPSAKLAICYLLWNSRKKEFARLKENGQLAAMLRTRETRLDRLRITYELGAVSVRIDDGVAYWDMTEKRLYVSRQSPAEQIAIEVPALFAARLSARPRELEDFIARMLSAGELTLTTLVRKHNWALPDEELAWAQRTIGLSETAASIEESEAEYEEPLNEEPEASATSSAETVEQILGDAAETDVTVPFPSDMPEEGQSVADNWGGRNQRSRTPRGKRSRATPVARASRRLAGMVYVESDGELTPFGVEQAERRTRTELAALDKVCQYEKKRTGVEPTRMPPGNPGFDVKSVNDDGSTRYIEVKGLSGQWDSQHPARVTPKELEKAQEHRGTYWLYVVEYALDKHYSLCAIQDPFGLIDRYAFEHGWRDVATVVEHGG